MKALVHIKDALEEYISGAPRVGRAIACADAASLWEKVVDKAVVGKTEAINVVGGTLFVSVPDPTLAQELSLKKSAILKKLNGELGRGNLVEDIRFKVGIVRRG